MSLPGQQFTATDCGDLCLFLQDICETCRHNKYCSILAHAGMYGGASEWRYIGGKPACIRHEWLPEIDRSADQEVTSA